MIVVAHRRNRLEDLRATPTTLGVEFDVRSRGSRLVVAHDATEEGPELEAWLDGYGHALLVCNPKEEGLAATLVARLSERGLGDFFLLGPDPGEALPLWDAGDHHVAVRVSEVHAPETALRLQGKPGWLWLDGFRGFPVDGPTARALAATGSRLCLCSPELYGRPESEIQAYQHAAAATGAPFAAVCTRAWGAWAAYASGARNTKVF